MLSIGTNTSISATLDPDRWPPCTPCRYHPLSLSLTGLNYSFLSQGPTSPLQGFSEWDLDFCPGHCPFYITQDQWARPGEELAKKTKEPGKDLNPTLPAGTASI